MNFRALGRTDLQVSVLGFGCGNVGGLMVRGSPAERERAVARALALGVNYFDTAPLYGDGQSERNLGQTLRSLRATAYLGTKFRLREIDLRDIPAAIGRSLDASLERLGMERVDLFQCHNQVRTKRDREPLAVGTLIDEVVPVLEKLRDAGKIRFFGITALGETPALHRAIDTGALFSAQACVNLLNPSAAVAVPPGFPAQDFERLLDRAHGRRTGVIVIRVLVAGALSGRIERHPIAAPSVEPIASGPDYATDVERARALGALVSEGYAETLTEAALRFPLAFDAVSTVLLGYSSLEHLEQAARAIDKGPLSARALARLGELWAGLANVRGPR